MHGAAGPVFQMLPQLFYEPIHGDEAAPGGATGAGRNFIGLDIDPPDGGDGLWGFPKWKDFLFRPSLPGGGLGLLAAFLVSLPP